MTKRLPTNMRDVAAMLPHRTIEDLLYLIRKAGEAS